MTFAFKILLKSQSLMASARALTSTNCPPRWRKVAHMPPPPLHLLNHLSSSACSPPSRAAATSPLSSWELLAAQQKVRAMLGDDKWGSETLLCFTLMNNRVLLREFMLALEAIIISNQQKAAGRSHSSGDKDVRLIHDVQKLKKYFRRKRAVEGEPWASSGFLFSKQPHQVN